MKRRSEKCLNCELSLLCSYIASSPGQCTKVVLCSNCGEVAILQQSTRYRITSMVRNEGESDFVRVREFVYDRSKVCDIPSDTHPACVGEFNKLPRGEPMLCDSCLAVWFGKTHETS